MGILDTLKELNKALPTLTLGVGEEYVDYSVASSTAEIPTKKLPSFLPFVLIGLFLYFLLRGKK